MRRPTTILAGFLAVGLMSSAVPSVAQTTAPKATTAPAVTTAREVDPAVTAFMEPVDSASDDDPLRQKLVERHNTAVRLLQVHIDRYRNGVADASSVFESAREVAESKMGLARDAAERLAIARQVLDVSRTVESLVEKQWKAGLGLEVNLLRARLARETAEVELLKLQQQQQQSSAATGPTTRPR